MLGGRRLPILTLTWKSPLPSGEACDASLYTIVDLVLRLGTTIKVAAGFVDRMRGSDAVNVGLYWVMSQSCNMERTCQKKRSYMLVPKRGRYGLPDPDRFHFTSLAQHDLI